MDPVPAGAGVLFGLAGRANLPGLAQRAEPWRISGGVDVNHSRLFYCQLCGLAAVFANFPVSGATSSPARPSATLTPPIFLYVATADHDVFKIGITRDLARRAQELKAVMIHSVMFDHKFDAELCERYLHRLFKLQKKHMSGEWPLS